MIDQALRKKAAQVLEVFRARGIKIATAESCTGGLVAAALTDIAGSSDVVDRGFVTYSNAAKGRCSACRPHVEASRRGERRDRDRHGRRRAEEFAG